MVLLIECSDIAVQASYTHIAKYAASLCCPNDAVTTTVGGGVQAVEPKILTTAFQCTRS